MFTSEVFMLVRVDQARINLLKCKCQINTRASVKTHQVRMGIVDDY